MTPLLPSSGAHWIEPAGSGASSSAQLAYLVLDSGDWVYSTTGPAQADWIDWDGSGDAELLALTPARIIADVTPGDLLIAMSTSDPVAAILIDGGGGNLDVTTDLTQPVAADLFVDGGGNLVVAWRTAPRRTAMQLAGGNLLIY